MAPLAILKISLKIQHVCQGAVWALGLGNLLFANGAAEAWGPVQAFDTGRTALTWKCYVMFLVLRWTSLFAKPLKFGFAEQNATTVWSSFCGKAFNFRNLQCLLGKFCQQFKGPLRCSKWMIFDSVSTFVFRAPLSALPALSTLFLMAVSHLEKRNCWNVRVYLHANGTNCQQGKNSNDPHPFEYFVRCFGYSTHTFHRGQQDCVLELPHDVFSKWNHFAFGSSHNSTAIASEYLQCVHAHLVHDVFTCLYWSVKGWSFECHLQLVIFVISKEPRYAFCEGFSSMNSSFCVWYFSRSSCCTMRVLESRSCASTCACEAVHCNIAFAIVGFHLQCWFLCLRVCEMPENLCVTVSPLHWKREKLETD